MERILKDPPIIKPVDANIKRPKWSVMIPAYNCLGYLEQTMQSVLQQDPGTDNMQIEVVDDCSTDGDVEKLVQQVGKGRISYFRQQKNLGHHRNFETCLNRSTGELVHLLHGDDLVHFGFYREVEFLFSKFPEIGAAFTNNGYIDEGANITYSTHCLADHPGIINDFLYQITQRQMLQFSAMVVKRKVYEHLGGFYGVNYCEDWQMWIRIAAHYPVGYSPLKLALYRGGQGNPASITSNALLTADNFRNIYKVIEMAQQYLPASQRKYIKRRAYKLYAEHIAKASNRMYLFNKKVAFIQGHSALKMYKSLRTIYWIARLYLANFRQKFSYGKPQRLLQAGS